MHWYSPGVFFHGCIVYRQCLAVYAHTYYSAVYGDIRISTHEITFKRQLNAYCTKEAEQMISKQKLTPKSCIVC